MRIAALRDTLEAEGPSITVHLDVRHGDASENHKIDVRWQALRAQLEEAGADQALVDVVEPEALRPPDDPLLTGRLVVARQTESGPEIVFERDTLPPANEHISVNRTPQLWPVIEQASQSIPYLLVLIDRVGGRILGEDPQGQRVDVSVEGEELDVHKVSVGGWAQSHVQRRSGNRWRDNIDGVVAVVTSLETFFDRPLIAVSGEERAVSIFRERAVTPWAGRVVVVDGGGRAPGSDLEEAQTEARRLAQLHALRQVRERASDFERDRGQGNGHAVMGFPTVQDCLQRGQVGVLLVNPDQGPDMVRKGLVSLAASTDAEVLSVPRSMLDLTDGVGALLRYQLTDTPGPTTV